MLCFIYNSRNILYIIEYYLESCVITLNLLTPIGACDKFAYICLVEMR